MFKYILITLFTLISINSFGQWTGGDPNSGSTTNTNTPGSPSYSTNPDPEGSDCIPPFPGWVGTENPFCNDNPTTNVPGTNVPIDDYIPFLLFAGIALGGIVIYRKQKQLS